MDQLRQLAESLKSRIQTLLAQRNLSALNQVITEMESQTLDSKFWSDTSKAQQHMQQLAAMKQEYDQLTQLVTQVQDATELIELIDATSQSDVQQLTIELRRIDKQLNRLEIKVFLSGKYDHKPAIISIHAGQGGTEAMDWVAMLTRMYIRYAETQEWQSQLIEEVPGEEAGYKSTSIIINGPYAYGYLKHEAGTHRLVRQSPFNADNLRQTSFALVEVIPQLPEDDREINIHPDEIEFEAFRSGGNGGQNVNKVSTAVRIKHLPTDIIVTCQIHRTQEQNRKAAMAILAAKLWDRRQQEKANQQASLKGNFQSASWGTQIRSYVLHPYKLVKDLRTEVESSDPDAILDGEIQPFVDQEIRTLQPHESL